MSTGPFLYDDDPAPLHTGTPRRRDRSMIAVLVLTVLLAIGTVVGMLVLRGSPADEARERASVFVAALAADDVEVASAILCEAERVDVPVEDALEPYRGLEGPVGDPREDEIDGGPVFLVAVGAPGRGTADLVLVPEGGPRVCGLR